MTEMRASFLAPSMAAILATGGLPAFAQGAAPSVKPASAPPAATQDQAARDLAQAAFAHPKAPPPPETPAAQIAAESAKAKAAAPPEPKPEWVSKEGVGIGGKGVEFKAPF